MVISTGLSYALEYAMARVADTPVEPFPSPFDSISGTVLPGALYVVATPIGNLGDFSLRAQAVLAGVDRICAEDTRVTTRLLAHFGLNRPLQALHEHNETRIAAGLIENLCAGASLALVSDAGTPLISDPGYVLVAAARAAGLPVYAVPGASAVLSALSISGLPTDRFVFEGFLPPKSGARRARLQALSKEPRTLVLYEASHRIAVCADDCAAILGERRICIARELTKRFEESALMRASALPDWIAADANRERGEFVLVVEGAPATDGDDAEAERVLALLLRELPVSTAARICAELTGKPRRALYDRALQMTADDGSSDNQQN